MPLQPNLIERRLISTGKMPGLMLDGAVGPWSGQTIAVALETGVVGALRERPMTVPELAEATGCAERGVEILVRALVPLQYLEPVDGDEEPRYRLTDVADRSLPDQDLQHIGTWFRQQAQAAFAGATEAVRKAPDDGVVGWQMVKEGDVGRGYQAQMRWLASDLVEPVVSRIELPDGAERMIDLGGSHGLYTVAFCQRNPGMEGTILDWPIGLEEAEKTLENRPEMGERIELVEGDFEEDEELPGGNDLAFLGNIVHGLDEEGNRELFAKIGEATTEKGMVAIVDQVEDPPASGGLLPFDPTDTSFARGISALVGWGLFLFSGGRSHAYDDLTAWLAEAGFEETRYDPIKESPGFSLIVARK